MQQTRGFVVAVAMATLLTGAPAAQARGTGEFDAEAEVAYTLGGDDVHCGDTLTHHTKLTHDLACPSTDAFALRVVGEGIVLDLGGHTVRRTGTQTETSQGIVLEARSMVRNGTIRGFNYGLVSRTGGRVRLHKLALLDNGYAVYDQGVTDFLVTDCLLSGNVVGLFSEFDASFGTYDVRNSVFTHNQTAMALEYHSADVLDSTFQSNEIAVSCFGASARIRSSTLEGNASVVAMGLDVGPYTCSELRIENTLIANNTLFAPPTYPNSAAYSFVLRDSLVVNNGSGLQAEAHTVYIEGNTFLDNAGGLTLADFPESNPITLTGPVRNNRFLSNDGDGLRVLPPSTPTVAGNLAVGNTGWGIHAPTAFDAGGNVARDNGAGNCEGVICTPF